MEIPQGGVRLEQIPQQYRQWFQDAARIYDVPLTLLLNVFGRETSLGTIFSNTPIARGIMQIGDTTASYHGINNRDPESSIFGAARILSQWDDPYQAIIGYNAGPGRVNDFLREGWGALSSRNNEAPWYVWNALRGVTDLPAPGLQEYLINQPASNAGTRVTTLDPAAGWLTPAPTATPEEQRAFVFGADQLNAPQGTRFDTNQQIWLPGDTGQPIGPDTGIPDFYINEGINQTDLGGGTAAGPNQDFLEDWSPAPGQWGSGAIGPAYGAALQQQGQGAGYEWNPEAGNWGAYGELPSSGSLYGGGWGSGAPGTDLTFGATGYGEPYGNTGAGFFGAPSSGQLGGGWNIPGAIGPAYGAALQQAGQGAGLQYNPETLVWDPVANPALGMGNQGFGNIADMSAYGYQPFNYTPWYGALGMGNPGNLASGFDMNAYNQAAGIGGGSGGGSFFDATPAPTIDYQHYFDTAGIPAGIPQSRFDTAFAEFAPGPSAPGGSPGAFGATHEGYGTNLPSTYVPGPYVSPGGESDTYASSSIYSPIPTPPGGYGSLYPAPMPAPTPQYYNSGIGPGGIAIAPGYNTTPIMTYNIGPGGVPMALGY